jgi:hypothetical protein
VSIITTSNLKSWLGITDTVDDTTLGFAVNATNQAIVEYCGRSFAKTTSGQETARVYRPVDDQVVYTDDFWQTTNLVVKQDTTDNGTYDETWTINTDFVVEPLNGLLHGRATPYYRLRAVSTRWWRQSRRPTIQVTAAWGWSTIPDAVTQAALIKGARVFKRKNSPEGVLGGFADYGAVRVTNREDPDVTMLLAPYRRPELVGLIG